MESLIDQCKAEFVDIKIHSLLTRLRQEYEGLAADEQLDLQDTGEYFSELLNTVDNLLSHLYNKEEL